MLTSPLRPRFAGLALVSLLLTLAACLPPPEQNEDGGTSNPDGSTQVDAGTQDAGAAAVCGNGKKEGSETCDDGNTTSGDGCSNRCVLEPGYTCETDGTPCGRSVTCGDGRVEGGETCDDRNTTSGDGCSNQCVTESGYLCPQSGGRCVAARCGDLIIAGDEECEDGNAKAGDGCSTVCRLEPGYKCEGTNVPCTKTICGDSVREGTEQCDDGNNNMGDGCSPLCEREPKCDREGLCQAVCGDGVILPGTNEQCDDGNTRSNDGCSSDCKYEEGFVCEVIKSTPPEKIEIPFVFRDFRGNDLAANASLNLPKGHIDFENKNGGEKGIVGALYAALGTDGKPVYAKATSGSSSTHGKATFDQWYRDTNNVNITLVKTLALGRLQNGSYRFDSNAFFELDGLGWVGRGPAYESPRDGGHNFNFTSETRYWFEYKETEVLSFRGDDDVWVYINGRLALDLGGVHGPESGTITLKEHASVDKLNLVKGRIYEAVVFQAERHTNGSNYQLTLSNFDTTSTQCRATCGNSIVDQGEECDDGINAGGYGKCARGCVWGPRCGDKIIQESEGEECDDGNTSNRDSCDNFCKAILN